MTGWEFSRPLLLVPAAALVALACLRYRPGTYYSPRRLWFLRVLRALALLSLVPVAGGIARSAATGGWNVILLADESSSISPEKARLREAFVDELRRRSTPQEPLTVLGFSDGVRIRSTAAAPLEAAAPVLAGPRTDIAAALAAAGGLAAPPRRTALVLLSDGEENAGSALRLAPQLHRAGIPVLAFDLSASAEVAIQGLSAPPRVYPGEEFAVTVTLKTTMRQEVVVRLHRDGRPVESRDILLEGTTEQEISFPQTAPPGGRLRLRLTVEPAGGLSSILAERSLEVEVATPVPIAYLTENPREAQDAVRFLRGAGLPVEVFDPGDWRRGAGLSAAPGVIVLDNISAPTLGTEGAARLERLIGEEGAGLLVFGGMQSLGAGEYQGTALERLLPVSMEIPPRGTEKGLGLVIVLDTSLSMFFRGQNEDPFYGKGPRKLDIAREAVREVLEALRPGDRIGLLESKDQLSWVRRPGPLGDRKEFEARLDGLFAIGGGINFYSSILEAFEVLRQDPAAIRHIMVVADANDIDQREVEQVGRSEDLIRRLAAENVTLSIFAIGNPTDKDISFLKMMTQLGRGDFYLVSTLAALPRYFRAEYRKKAGEWFREEPFPPLVRTYAPAVLRGLNVTTLPETGGVNLVATKRGAEELLIAPFGTPLLSLWRFGRGRTAVFASDSGARWARRWFSWPEAPRFWNQLFAELAPRPAPPALEVRARADPRTGKAELLLRRSDGGFVPLGAREVRFSGPAGQTRAPLERLGLDRFEMQLPREDGSGYTFSVMGDPAQEEAAGRLESPPVIETVRHGGGRELLDTLVRATGGCWVKSPAEVAQQLPAAEPGLPEPQFWLLLFGVLCLFGELVIRY